MVVDTPLGWAMVGSPDSHPSIRAGKKRKTKPNARQRKRRRESRGFSSNTAAVFMTQGSLTPQEFPDPTRPTPEENIEEMVAYARDEVSFIQKTAGQVRHGHDGMLQFPLPFA